MSDLGELSLKNYQNSQYEETLKEPTYMKAFWRAMPTNKYRREMSRDKCSYMTG